MGWRPSSRGACLCQETGESVHLLQEAGTPRAGPRALSLPSGNFSRSQLPCTKASNTCSRFHLARLTQTNKRLSGHRRGPRSVHATAPATVLKCICLHQGSANVFHKRPESTIFALVGTQSMSRTTQLCRCSPKGATDNVHVNEHGCVPIKVHLRKQAVGHCLLTPDLD